jgi:hypothetical protein
MQERPYRSTLSHKNVVPHPLRFDGLQLLMASGFYVEKEGLPSIFQSANADRDKPGEPAELLFQLSRCYFWRHLRLRDG